MLSAYQQAVRTNPATDFRTALAVNAGTATLNLKLPLRDPLWFIRAISIVSVQALAWELMLFTRADNMDGSIVGQNFSSVWQFGEPVVGPPATPGWPFDIPDVTPQPDLYNYYVDGNMMPYMDMDQMGTPNPYADVPLGRGVSNANPSNASLHVRLVNRSSTGKLADDDGALQVIFYVATQGMQV